MFDEAHTKPFTVDHYGAAHVIGVNTMKTIYFIYRLLNNKWTNLDPMY